MEEGLALHSHPPQPTDPVEAARSALGVLTSDLAQYKWAIGTNRRQSKQDERAHPFGRMLRARDAREQLATTLYPRLRGHLVGLDKRWAELETALQGNPGGAPLLANLRRMRSEVEVAAREAYWGGIYSLSERAVSEMKDTDTAALQELPRFVQGHSGLLVTLVLEDLGCVREPALRPRWQQLFFQMWRQHALRLERVLEIPSTKRRRTVHNNLLLLMVAHFEFRTDFMRGVEPALCRKELEAAAEALGTTAELHRLDAFISRVPERLAQAPPLRAMKQGGGPSDVFGDPEK